MLVAGQVFVFGFELLVKVVGVTAENLGCGVDELVPFLRGRSPLDVHRRVLQRVVEIQTFDAEVFRELHAHRMAVTSADFAAEGDLLGLTLCEKIIDSGYFTPVCFPEHREIAYVPFK